MKINTKYCTNNNNYKWNAKRSRTDGVMVHSVGVAQSDPWVFWRQWNENRFDVITHGLVSADEIINCLPWDNKGWHAGTGWSGNSANNNYVSFEITEPKTIKYTGGAGFIDTNPAETKKQVLAAYRNAVELTAYLCKKYGFNPLDKNRVISHAEGYKLGIATGHADPTHLWSKFGLSMDGFRKDVSEFMEGKDSTISGTEGGSGVDYSKRSVISYLNVADLDSIMPLIKFLEGDYIIDIVDATKGHDMSGYRDSNWRLAIGGEKSAHSKYMNFHIGGKNREETKAKILDFRNNADHRKNYAI